MPPRLRYYCTPVPGESKWSSGPARGQATTNTQVGDERRVSQKRTRDDENQEMTEADDTGTKRSMGDNAPMEEAVAVNLPDGGMDMATSTSAAQAGDDQLDCIVKVRC